MPNSFSGQLFSAELKGLRDVDAKLALLGSVAGEKVMRSVMFAAMKPVVDQAKQNIAEIPNGSGALAKATRRVYLRASRGIKKSTGTRFTVAVAPKVKDRVAISLANLHYKRKKPIRGIFWGHLVEWGFRTRSGAKIEGRLVYTRALQSKAAQVISTFQQRIKVAVDKALKKQTIA